MTRTCSDCPAPISAKSKGRCRACSARYMNETPEIAERRRASVAAHFATPGAKEMRAAALAAWNRDMPEAERERRRANGRRLAKEVLARPDVRAKVCSPDTRRRAGATRTDTVLAWCPADRRDEYRVLVIQKRIPAAEARAIIEAEIVGTVEHARRAIANIKIAQRLRVERERREAY